MRRVVLVVLLGCASPHSPAFVRAMHAAEDFTANAHYREAAQAFDAAAATTERRADRDEALHAAATMIARAGDTHAALARLDALAKASPAGPEAGSAAYDAAWLRIQRDDADAGWRGLDAMLHEFPGDGDARPALHHLLEHKDETMGPAGTLAYLRQLQVDLHAPDREEELAYEVALRLEATGSLDAAREAFLAEATRWPYPAGALWDDALYHASLLDERAGRPKDAVLDLERMLAKRERASFVGSAERARYADAELHIGELYRDRLGDHARALTAFHHLFEDFPDSPIRDRGLFEEASLLHADGKLPEACARLVTLVRAIPESRYVPCAPALCPALSVPSSHAPPAASECHAYLERH